MSAICYSVAMSLDGYIAGPNGETDWIAHDPAFDFGQLWLRFDTLLMGRRTYAAAVDRLGKNAFSGKQVFVVSRTLRDPNVTVLEDLSRESVQAVRSQSQTDIWLMGGGETFRSLLSIGEVDTVEVNIIAVLLGGGVPMLPPSTQRTSLKLTCQQAYPSGMLLLRYDVIC